VRKEGQGPQLLVWDFSFRILPRGSSSGECGFSCGMGREGEVDLVLHESMRIFSHAVLGRVSRMSWNGICCSSCRCLVEAVRETDQSHLQL
jgi:hypothetical protein